jgi:hypothetical protein
VVRKWTEEDTRKAMPAFLAFKAEQAKKRQVCVKCRARSEGPGDWPFEFYCPAHVPEGWLKETP